MLYERRESRANQRLRTDVGQTTIFVLLALAIFLLGLVGFAVDMTNLWFHRQMSQGAADAACQAGAMDLLFRAEGVTVGAAGNFTLPNSGSTKTNCSTSTADTPCWYGRANGYSSDTATNLVSYTLYASGASPGPSLPAPPDSTIAPVPFIRVDVTDHVKMSFSSLIPGASKSRDVVAYAICGITLVTVPVPMIILDPTRDNSLFFNGTGNAPKLTITGGPPQSIQVNSSSSLAVKSNGNPTVDLSAAGPNGTGGIFGVYGTEAQSANGGWTFRNLINPTPTTESYVSPHSPINDPFEEVPPPNIPSNPPNPIIDPAACPYTLTGSTPPWKIPGPSPSCAARGGVATPGAWGCPVTAGCYEYTRGLYPLGITVTGINSPAMFDPGIYYLQGSVGLQLGPGGSAQVLPTTAPGDGTGGTMFYFADTGTLRVQSNPSGTFRGQNTSDGTYIGRPDGKGGPGIVPGLVFFQNRDVQVLPPPPTNLGGSGTFSIIGSFYIHQCKSADGTGKGTNCDQPPAGDVWPDPAHGYNDLYDLSGTSGGSTTILGLIIVDRLTLSGTPGVRMQLLPNFIFPVLRATMFR